MAESTYDDIAEWYDAWAGSTLREDPFFPAVEALSAMSLGNGSATSRAARGAWHGTSPHAGQAPSGSTSRQSCWRSPAATSKRVYRQITWMGTTGRVFFRC